MVLGPLRFGARLGSAALRSCSYMRMRTFSQLSAASTHGRGSNTWRKLRFAAPLSLFLGVSAVTLYPTVLCAKSDSCECTSSIAVSSDSVADETGKDRVHSADMQLALRLMKDILGEESVMTDHDYCSGFGHDLSYHSSGVPDAVVYPRTEEHVSQILAICHQFNIPITAFGGGTSLEGHTTCISGGICLNFAQMTAVIAFHPEDLDVTVEPGITWEELNAFLKDHNLFLPVDPGPGASLGGMVACGCSGTLSYRYGPIKKHVLSLRVVLADGTVLKTGQRAPKSSAGYDLTSLFTGSEGTLGIITAITIKVAPLPPVRAVCTCTFPTVSQAAAAVSACTMQGLQPMRAELLDVSMMRALNLVKDAEEAAYPEQPTLLIEISGRDTNDVTRLYEALQKIFDQHSGSQAAFAHEEKEKEYLWRARKMALFASAALSAGSDFLVTDVCVPISLLPQVIKETEADIAAAGLAAPMVAHVGEGNFHLVIRLHLDDPTEVAAAKELNDRLIRRAIAVGGTCTGEHGVGRGKRLYLYSELGMPAMKAMRTLKEALDPKGILNPGKQI